MYKYLMVNPEDYRPDNKNHEVLQVKEENGVCYAYGYFTTLTEDMVKVTDEELSTMTKIEIPNISLRQCRELLILTGRFDDVVNAIESVEDETKKVILKNYWEYSTEFERKHKFLGNITSALGMTEDEVDEFFIRASKL